MSEWQPIETAPKDGTYVLVSWGDEHIPPAVLQHWSGDDCWVNDFGEEYFTPTRWMPLPTPPVEDE